MQCQNMGKDQKRKERVVNARRKTKGPPRKTLHFDRNWLLVIIVFVILKKVTCLKIRKSFKILGNEGRIHALRRPVGKRATNGSSTSPIKSNRF